jgi:hypothetical protein
MSGDCEVGKGGIIKCVEGHKPGDDEGGGNSQWVGLSIGAFLLIVGAFIFTRRERPKSRGLR